MPSIYRALFFAAHAASLAMFFAASSSSLQALAKPIGLPFPLLDRDAHPVELSPRAAKPKVLKAKVSPNNGTRVSHPGLSYRSAVSMPSNHSSLLGRPRDITASNILNNLAILNNYYSRANDNAQTLKTYSTQASTRRGDATFSQQCSDELSAFQTNILGFQTVLTQLGGDKGLANYDKNNQLETLLKDVVNVNKNALSATTTLVYEIPTLGPILGPIVYEIKCILDAVLDATENLTDAILNALQPTLEPLIAEYGVAACSSGIAVVGICL